METLYVNLFGGPGTGKSTTMAGVFSLLKLHGINCEIAPEFAKEVCWEKEIRRYRIKFIYLENSTIDFGD